MSAENIAVMLVGIGLLLSTIGAWRIWQSDRPKTDWILRSLMSAAEKPPYAVLAPDDADWESLRTAQLAEVRSIHNDIKKNAECGRLGMALVFVGFAFQFLGNAILILFG